MSITKLDHVTVVTDDAAATAEFYEVLLGLTRGLRPKFAVPGVWLYCGGDPVLHIVERPRHPAVGALEHFAFQGTNLAEVLERLKARRIPYDLRRLPDGGPVNGLWQLFFEDPNGARVEIHVPLGDAARNEPNA
jgi:catechol 2,3-dioxygenase-like lactoylglutathione lyase family enzyme